METIQHHLWDKVENSNTKIAKKVYNIMNNDTFSVILDRDVFWFEKTYSEAYIPEYVYKYAKNFYRKMGYMYLYDIKTN